VETFVGEYLSKASVPGATITVSPSSFVHAGFGDPVAVTCSVLYAQVTWLPAPRFLGGVTLTGRSVMCAERSE
jgi:hypothetical protein